MWWSSSDGRIELNITAKQADICTHSGPCDDDVMALSKEPKIRRQTDKLKDEDIVNELKQYGAWEDDELKDRAQNIQRLLWLACGDIDEGRRVS